MPNQFRCAFFTNEFESTVDFYKNTLGFEMGETWDRASDDKGAIFLAGTGMIEVLTMPRHNEDWVWDKRRPQGLAIVIEIEDIDGFYKGLLNQGAPITVEIADMEWGHRTFQITDPNGARLYFFSEIDRKQ